MYNIVLVEDELIELDALHVILNKGIENVNIFSASRGKDAIKLIDELRKIDLILVDINIPLPSGLDVIRYLRQKTNETKIVVTTANDDIDMARNMFGLKVDDYLLKPIKPNLLLETVKNCLHFDEQKNLENKQKKSRIINILEKCEYMSWMDLIVNDVVNTAYLSPKEGRQILSNFIVMMQQIVKMKGWVVNELRDLDEKVNHSQLSKHSYYKMLRVFLDISNTIFDVAYHASNSRLDSIYKAQFYMGRHIFKNISLDEVADNSYISSSYLSRLFKKRFNIGFSEFLTTQKIEIAKKILQHSDLQINTIALELAYQDANYFCRIFKKEVGLSPSEYRRSFDEN